jgi:hypothetical protein
VLDKAPHHSVQAYKDPSKHAILLKRQPKWYGHVVRMGEERKPKQFLEARPEERRPRGGPRKSYEDGI